jgi:hypothetical protein
MFRWVAGIVAEPHHSCGIGAVTHTGSNGLAPLACSKFKKKSKTGFPVHNYYQLHFIKPPQKIFNCFIFLLHIKLRNASILSPDAGAAKNDAALVGNNFL